MPSGCTGSLPPNGSRIVSRLLLVRFILAAAQHGAVHVALAVAHNLRAPQGLQPLRASDATRGGVIVHKPSAWRRTATFSRLTVSSFSTDGAGRAYAGGSFWRVAWTPFRMASPIRMILPTAIH